MLLYFGTLKSFNPTEGYGFIYCKEVLQERGRDAFISRDEYERGGCPEVGASLQFRLLIGKNGQPQACNLQAAGRGDSKGADFGLGPGGSGAWKGKAGFSRDADAKGSAKGAASKDGSGKRGYAKDDVGYDSFAKDSFGKNGFGMNHFGKNGFGKDGFGKDGYGKDGFGKDGFGKDGYGKEGYGKDGYGKDGYGKDGYGKDGKERFGTNGQRNDFFGKDGFGKAAFGKDSFGKDAYGKDAYGKDAYGKDGFGKDGFGKDSLSKGGFGTKGFVNDSNGGIGNGLNDFGKDSFGKGGSGKAGFVKDGVGKGGMGTDAGVFFLPNGKGGHDQEGSGKGRAAENGADNQNGAADGTAGLEHANGTSPGARSPERAQLLLAVRKQVEWYFSDANLSTDELFYKKISAAMPEGWLQVAWILRCRKVKELGATSLDIYQALESSHLEADVQIAHEPSDLTSIDFLDEHLFVRRRQPLPPFVGKEHRRADGLVVDDTELIKDPFRTMDRLKDQRRVQETLGLKEVGDEHTIFREPGGLIIARGYERVIYGDHGPYVEFSRNQIAWEAWPQFHDKSRYGSQRSYDEDFTNKAYAEWQRRWDESRSNDGGLMLYAQRQSVDKRPYAPGPRGDRHESRASGYADYRVGCYYVAAEASVIEVTFLDGADELPLSPERTRRINDSDSPCSPPDVAQLSMSPEDKARTDSVCWSWQQGRCWNRSCKWLHTSV
jgi:pentapeptide MXKDX repeat protein